MDGSHLTLVAKPAPSIDPIPARTAATMIAKWGVDLLQETCIAVERQAQPGVCVFTEGAHFKIKAIRAELDDLEAVLKGDPMPVRTQPERA